MQPKSWPRLVAEAFAIVVSILSAFAIDAWWSERQLRDQEAQAIGNLRSEFRVNVLTIDAAMAHHRGSIEAGERLIAAARGDQAVPSRPQLDTLLVTAFIDFATYESNSSALNDLLSSGRLGLIRDDTLRAALAVWPTAVADVVEDQLMVVRMVETQLLPYLTPRVPTSALYNAGHAVFGPFPTSERAIDFAALSRDPSFESHLANRMAHERQVLSELERYLKPVAELIVQHLSEARD